MLEHKCEGCGTIFYSEYNDNEYDAVLCPDCELAFETAVNTVWEKIKSGEIKVSPKRGGSTK